MNTKTNQQIGNSNQQIISTNSAIIWRSQGRLINIPQPSVMGIINITPDSYIKESRIDDEKNLIQKAAFMLEHGAAILDIGAASSRPGAVPPDLNTEMSRIKWAVQCLHNTFPDAIISIDTWRSAVAELAINEGAHIINDISAGEMDPGLPELAARLKIPYIWMHMRGTPETMQDQTDYKNIILDILDYFLDKKNKFHNLGITDQMIDPGFGFAKTLEQNYAILRDLPIFKMLKLPILVGISRKSMITRLLDIKAEEALPATSALHMVALQHGASLLRAHDVKEAYQTIQLFKQLDL
jgi:dihydropteroate synthase